MNDNAIINNLTYLSFRYNRLSCGMSAEGAAKLFLNAEAMERRLQRELAQQPEKERVKTA